MMIVALVDDLMFLSRIREAAGRTGAEVRAVRNGSALLEACRAAPALVVADLDSPRLQAAEAIRALRDDPAGASITVIGFYSHVHDDRAQAAAAAGASRAMPRSAFVRELPGLIAGGAAPE